MKYTGGITIYDEEGNTLFDRHLTADEMIEELIKRPKIDPEPTVEIHLTDNGTSPRTKTWKGKEKPRGGGETERKEGQRMLEVRRGRAQRADLRGLRHRAGRRRGMASRPGRKEAQGARGQSEAHGRRKAVDRGNKGRAQGRQSHRARSGGTHRVGAAQVA